MNNDVFTKDIVAQWEKHYKSKNVKEIMESCENDNLLKPYFLRYLPKGKILEAGCGFGHWFII